MGPGSNSTVLFSNNMGAQESEPYLLDFGAVYASKTFGTSDGRRCGCICPGVRLERPACMHAPTRLEGRLAFNLPSALMEYQSW